METGFAVVIDMFESMVGLLDNRSTPSQAIDTPSNAEQIHVESERIITGHGLVVSG
jgi:hypothetical protein